MAVRKRTYGDEFGLRSEHAVLRDELAAELRDGRRFGQPFVEEEHFPRSGAVSVTVVWDRWVGVEDRYRPEIIESSYRDAEPEIAERISLAGGFTVPEAVDLDTRTFEVRADPRVTDSVTAVQVAAALRELGASDGFPFEPMPVLRLETEREAHEYRDELIARLPESNGVWEIVRHVRTDVGEALELPLKAA